MDEDLRQRAHDLDVTVWVGKSGLDPVVDELADQLGDHDLVKVKFLRAARGVTSTEELAADLAERAGADLVDPRSHCCLPWLSRCRSSRTCSRRGTPWR
jgi:RNA-binding protein